MAAHDQKGDRLFPEGLSPEELAEHLRHLPEDLELSEAKRREYELARTDTLAWYTRSAEQFRRIWEDHQKKFSVLAGITPENFELEKAKLHGQVPSYVWDSYEKAEHLLKEKKELEHRQAPLPLHEEHEGHARHGKHEDFPLFATPQYLDHDTRYHDMVKEKVTTWNKENPQDQISGDIFTVREDNSVVIHEEILKRMPTLHEDVEKEFAEKHPDAHAYYQEQEAKRVYTDKDGKALPENDPLYKKIQEQIKQQTNDELAKQQEALFDFDSKLNEATEAEYARRQEETYQLAKTQYAHSSQKIDKDALREEVRQQLKLERPAQVSEEEIEKKIRDAAFLTLIEKHPEKAHAYAEKDPHLKIVLTAYEDRKAREKAEKVVAAGVVIGMQNAPKPVADIITKESDRGQYRLVEAPHVTPGLPIITTPQQVAEPPQEAAPSGPPPSQPPIPPRRRRRPPPPPPPPPGGKGPAAAAALAGQATKRFLLWVFAAVGIKFFIILFLVVLLFIVFGGGHESQEENGSGQQIPVKITKTGPATINNGEDVTYDISVSYAGTATNIIVTDNIPEGATFVSASGKFLCDGRDYEPTLGSTCNTITWNLNDQGGSPSPGTSTSPTQGQGYNPAYYEGTTGLGFPPPQNPNPLILEGEELNRWKTYLMPHVVKASSILGIDPGIVPMWAWRDTQFTAYAENCDKEHNTGDNSPDDGNPNTTCPYWGGYWQVGYGMHVASVIDWLPDAFDAMYGNSETATVKQVGDRVIKDSGSRYPIAITFISSFPNRSIEDIVQSANSGEQAARNLAATLMKDDALAAYLIGRQFRDHEGLNNTLADRMDSYDGGGTYYTKQDLINRIRAIYTAGLSGGAGRSFPQTTLKLTVKPNSDNVYIVNQASALVVGGSSGSGSGGSTVNGCIGSPQNDKWAKLNEYDALFLQASEEFGIDPHLMKAMAMVESGGVGHYAADGSVLQGCDAYGQGCAVGVLQVKPEIWYDPPDSIGRQINANPMELEGNIRLGTKLMQLFIEETGSWQNAIKQKYHPGVGQHGKTPEDYVNDVVALMAELEAAATCTP